MDRVFDGHAHRERPGLRACGVQWNYVCLLIDLRNREIVGRTAGVHKNARLVKSVFAMLDFPLGNIEVFHADRGSEFDSMAIDELLDFWYKCSLSKKGAPHDNAVDKSTNKILKAEFDYRERFSTLHELQVKLSNYVHWYNNFRPNSTLGYMSPVEFRLAGLTL